MSSSSVYSRSSPTCCAGTWKLDAPIGRTTSPVPLPAVSVPRPRGAFTGRTGAVTRATRGAPRVGIWPGTKYRATQSGLSSRSTTPRRQRQDIAPAGRRDLGDGSRPRRDRSASPRTSPPRAVRARPGGGCEGSSSRSSWACQSCVPFVKPPLGPCRTFRYSGRTVPSLVGQTYGMKATLRVPDLLIYSLPPGSSLRSPQRVHPDGRSARLVRTRLRRLALYQEGCPTPGS